MSRRVKAAMANVRVVESPVSSCDDASSCSSSAAIGSTIRPSVFLDFLDPLRVPGGSGGASQSSATSPSPTSLVRSGVWLRDLRTILRRTHARLVGGARAYAIRARNA